jgi:hypothetical protein
VAAYDPLAAKTYGNLLIGLIKRLTRVIEGTVRLTARSETNCPPP